MVDAGFRHDKRHPAGNGRDGRSRPTAARRTPGERPRTPAKRRSAAGRPPAARARGHAHQTFFAVTAHGLEDVLAGELRILGVDDVRSVGGGVGFSGTLRDAYAACLWSRTAERVLLELARFPATTRDELYAGLRTVDWTDHLSPKLTFACHAIGTTPHMRNSHYAALVLKDAVVDQIRERAGDRPSVDLKQPDVRLQLLLRAGHAVVSLDLAGEALHRRGYRTPGRQVEAPLKETLAAGVLLLGGWSDLAAHGLFLDPLCGSGTLTLEAGQMAADVAPGLGRRTWGFLRWHGHQAETWHRLTEAAASRGERGLATLKERVDDLGRPPLSGFDRDPRAVALGRAGALRAGLAGLVAFEVCHLRDLRTPYPLPNAVTAARPAAGDGPPGLVATNPPYGARLAAHDLDTLYEALGETLRRELEGWRAAVLVADERRAATLGATVSVASPRLHNGPIDCTLLVFDVGTPPGDVRGVPAVEPSPAGAGETAAPPAGPVARPTGAVPPAQRSGGADREGPLDFDDAARQFGDRLRRNARVLGRPLRRRGIDCYRLYDADLPDFNLAIDLYADWAHVQEYQAPAHVDPDKAAARLTAALRILPEATAIPSDHVVVKTRRRQRGTGQYESFDRQDRQIEVHEADATFLVNLTDHIDTGLFLDQRLVRDLIRSAAAGVSFLNLFGYTGTATVAAALGDARRSLTVDLSRVYLEWARDNFERNGLDGRGHRTLRCDITRWLREAARERGRYDLVLMGPPTFSNSAGMGRATLDVQRDHVDLLRAAAKLLTPHGVLLFVCGARRFAFAAERLTAYTPVDLSSRTLPPDFARRGRAHHVWRLQTPEGRVRGATRPDDTRGRRSGGARPAGTGSPPRRP